MKKVLPIILLLLIVLVFIFRPWFHWLFFFFYKHYLLTLLLLFLLFLWGFFLFRYLLQWSEDTKNRIRVSPLLILLTSIITILIILYPIFYSALLRNTLVKAIDYKSIQNLEDSTAFRYLPLPVVERISRDRYQEPTHRLLEYQPLIIEDTFAWVTPRTPDGFINTWRLRANGLMVIRDDGATTLIDRPLTYSEGQRFLHNIQWHLLKKKYFIQLPEFMYIPYGEEIYIVAPYISWKLSFPVRYPQLAGAFIIDSQGHIEEYSLEEAARLPFIQRLFPEYLARLYASSYALKNGIMNYFFFHEDQVEIIDVGANNKQPYMIPTEDGLMWFTATEPYGDAHGVFKIFITQAMTGETRILELDMDTMLLGPQRSISYVRRKNPEISWYEEETKTGSFVILEPRPLIIENTLYWLNSITTRDFAEISYTALVNASTREVTRIPSLDALISILQEGQLEIEDLELQELEGRDRILQLIEELERDQDLLKEKLEEMRRLLESL